jgi:hypothetical protein
MRLQTDRRRGFDPADWAEHGGRAVLIDESEDDRGINDRAYLRGDRTIRYVAVQACRIDE